VIPPFFISRSYLGNPVRNDKLEYTTLSQDQSTKIHYQDELKPTKKPKSYRNELVSSSAPQEQSEVNIPINTQNTKDFVLANSKPHKFHSHHKSQLV